MCDETFFSGARQHTVEIARAFSALDAYYRIQDFNERCWIMKQKPITPDEVVQNINSEQLETIMHKANALKADEAYFGEKYWTGRSNDEILKEMLERHPEFAQTAHELALSRGIVAMR